MEIQQYLRWVANEEAVAKNINDWALEGSGKLIEMTIKYKDLEWSFSCSENDYKGHSDSGLPEAQQPHYHFQMRIDRQPFINFNQTHIPFHESDLCELEAQQILHGKVDLADPAAPGIREIMEHVPLEDIVNTSDYAQEPEDGLFHFQSILIADDGQKISGDDIADIMKEARKSGKSIASLLHKIPNADSKTLVTPGPGVVEQAVRTKLKRGQK